MDKFIIMPNHLHVILIIENGPKNLSNRNPVGSGDISMNGDSTDVESLCCKVSTVNNTTMSNEIFMFKISQNWDLFR